MLAEKEVIADRPGTALPGLPETQNARQIRRILIVDDSESLAVIIQHMLEIAGYETHTAYDAQSGYRSYIAFRPDLVISDVFMGGEGGPEMMRRIIDRDPDAKVIYMSGYPIDTNDLSDSEGRAYPAPRFLPKPFSRSQLLAMIETFSADTP